MSEENVAIVERAYRTWHEQGLEGLRAVMHDEVEWHPPSQAPEPGPFRGPDEILRVAVPPSNDELVVPEPTNSSLDDAGPECRFHARQESAGPAPSTPSRFSRRLR